MILSIEICPQLGSTHKEASAELEAFLQKILKEIEGSETTHAGTYLLFTTDKVVGEFCHGSHFSIRQLPPEAEVMISTVRLQGVRA